MMYAIKNGMSLTEFWDSTNRDLFNYILATNDKRSEEIELGWDYARHIMWAMLQPNSKEAIKVSSIIRLKRDGPIVPELTPYEKQELAKWSTKCDQDMIDAGATLVDWDENPIK
jgi:hypothetical protein